jgi:protein tyrosine phosphatase (PTP) superfamily phosphohydrolase (DUF442 family)
MTLDSTKSSRTLPSESNLAVRLQLSIPALLLAMASSAFFASLRDRAFAENPRARQADSARIDVPGLRNVYRITAMLVSGSSPEGDEGFRSLARLGIKTIISVDGARPDTAAAHRHGLRYVHIPVGYDGLSRQQVLALAKAARDLPGPFYVHCHHGQHRGPAAAAVVHLCSDERCTVEQALTEMRRAGTDPRYKGLYDAPRTLVRPTVRDLDGLPAHFPEVAEVPGLTQCMAEIDRRWDNLKLIRSAGWKTPDAHADLDPPHEALQLKEQFREVRRLNRPDTQHEPFQRWLADIEQKAQDLEEALRVNGGQVNHSSSERLFHSTAALCTQCHAMYRDMPRER